MQIIEKLKNENDPEAQKALSEISKELLEKISREGLGYMSKTDLETFIFHLYLKNLGASRKCVGSPALQTSNKC